MNDYSLQRALLAILQARSADVRQLVARTGRPLGLVLRELHQLAAVDLVDCLEPPLPYDVRHVRWLLTPARRPPAAAPALRLVAVSPRLSRMSDARKSRQLAA